MSAEGTGSRSVTEFESFVEPDSDSGTHSHAAIGGAEDAQGTGSKSRLSGTFH